MKLRGDEPLAVVTDDNQIVEASTVRRTDEVVTLLNAAGVATQSLLLERVAYVKPEPWRTGDGFGFKGAINMALVFERGNTVTDEYDIDSFFEVLYGLHGLRFEAEGERDEAGGVLAKNKWNVLAQYTYAATNRLYYGFTGLVQLDEFASLDLRTAAGPLVGYHFIQDDSTNLSGTVSLLHAKEQFETGPSRDFASLGWRLDFSQDFWDDRLEFYHRQLGLLNIETTDDFLIRSWTGFRTPPLFGYVVTGFEVEVEYDNEPRAGSKSTDITYGVKLGYRW